MDYSRLEKGIMDFIQEEQVKLGYRKEKIRLYYPLSSLKHLLEEEVSGKSTEELEKEFYEAAGIRLGRVEISRNKDRFCFVVPEEGAEYVHEIRCEGPRFRAAGVCADSACRPRHRHEVFPDCDFHRHRHGGWLYSDCGV